MSSKLIVAVFWVMTVAMVISMAYLLADLLKGVAHWAQIRWAEQGRRPGVWPTRHRRFF
jgi:hypothetical protein